MREAKVCAFNEEVLAEGIRQCTVFRMCDPCTNIVHYYYGGGLLDRKKGVIILWKDVLRPLSNIEVQLSDLLYCKFDGTVLDLLCRDGVWISSIVIPKIQSESCIFRYLKFDDPRLITYNNDIAIVNLPLLDVSVVEVNQTTMGYPPESEILYYPNPLTIAYTKRNGVIYIGYWDIIEGHFVGKLKEYWMKLLDIKL